MKDQKKIQISTFEELNKTQLYQILQLRAEVFVVEQNCPYQDVDDLDMGALHLFSITAGQLESYARIMPPNYEYKGYTAIGRVIVKKPFRGSGLGRVIMEKSMAFCREKYPEVPIKIMAQTYLLNFYESLGFKRLSDEFLEDGIPHWYMTAKPKKVV